MNEIQITITIPESEYKEWGSYDTNELIFDLKRDLSNYLQEMYIRNFEINIEERKYGN